MRLIITFSFVLFTLTTFGQTRVLDKGSGDYQKLGKAVTLLESIEQGKAQAVYSHLPKSITVDTIEFEKIIHQVSEIHPYEEGSTPPAFVNDKSSSLWYERTYFTKTETGIEYQIQIYLELTENNGSVMISKIEFREKDEIKPRTKEIEQLDKVDENNPPPPPAPPGMK